MNTLYRFYDASDQLLYIGITLDPIARLRAHRATKGRRWAQIATITLEQFPDRTSIIRAEAEAIRNERPLWNIQHNTPRPSASLPADEPRGLAAIFPTGTHVAISLDNMPRPIVVSGTVVASGPSWVQIHDERRDVTYLIHGSDFTVHRSEGSPLGTIDEFIDLYERRHGLSNAHLQHMAATARRNLENLAVDPKQQP